MVRFSEQEIALFKEQVAPMLNGGEFRLFIRVCQTRGLEPGTHVVPVKFKTRHGDRVSYITTVQALRTLADRTGLYRGSINPRLRVATKDGPKTIPHEEYDPEEHTRIISASIDVLRAGFDHPVTGTALFKSFAKTGSGGEVWSQHPDILSLIHI